MKASPWMFASNKGALVRAPGLWQAARAAAAAAFGLSRPTDGGAPAQAWLPGALPT